MAEFQEVIKQWGRMLDAHKHGESIAIEASVPADAFKDAKLVEEIVMQWAADHPEPVYPTWFEWFKTVVPDEEMLQRGMYWDMQIPADIAEKLGLQPKEDA